MNALQDLIQQWLDAEPGRSERSLAKKAGVSPGTVNAIMKRDRPKAPPREATLRGLARGLDLPYRSVREAAVAAYLIRELDTDDIHFRAWVAMLDDLSEEQRQVLWDTGRAMLRRMQQPSGQ